MKVLALDIATNTGAAVGKVGGVPLCWSVSFGKGRSEAVRFSKAIRFTHACIEQHQPDLVAVECPIGGKNASKFLIGIYSCVVGQASLMGCDIVEYRVQSIRKHFLGRALTTRDFPGMSKSASKAQIKKAVMDRCALLKWDTPDDDAADAAALWDKACSELNTDHQMKTVGGLLRDA